MTWKVRTGDPVLKELHSCDLPKVLSPREMEAKLGYEVPDGHPGDIYECDTCGTLYEIEASHIRPYWAPIEGLFATLFAYYRIRRAERFAVKQHEEALDDLRRIGARALAMTGSPDVVSTAMIPAPVDTPPPPPPTGDEPSELDGAMFVVYLEGNWRWITSKMTTPQRNAAADAVDRYSATLDHGDGEVSEPIERWWRAP